jgi:hypothetical protein
MSRKIYNPLIKDLALAEKEFNGRQQEYKPECYQHGTVWFRIVLRQFRKE